MTITVLRRETTKSLLVWLKSIRRVVNSRVHAILVKRRIVACTWKTTFNIRVIGLEVLNPNGLREVRGRIKSAHRVIRSERRNLATAATVI